MLLQQHPLTMRQYEKFNQQNNSEKLPALKRDARCAPANILDADLFFVGKKYEYLIGSIVLILVQHEHALAGTKQSTHTQDKE